MISRLILSKTNPQEDGSLQDEHHGNQDYKKVLTKTSGLATNFIEVLDWTRTGLPVGMLHVTFNIKKQCN